MNLAWKFLLPMTLANVVVASIWHFTFREGWTIGVRWLVCAALLVVPYLLFSRGFQTRLGRREYRYAD
jgi:NADH-quinone oxidoreductase subunit H